MMKAVTNTIYDGKEFTGTELESLTPVWISFLKELEKMVQQVPLWKQYRPKNFENNVKKLIKVSEDCDAFDEAGFLYEILEIILLDPKKTDEGHSFFFPYPGCSCCIITRESSFQQMKHGTTGHFTWPAAVAFVEFIMSQQRSIELSGKRLLEIGCGVGFLGISLMAVVNIESYTFTDHKQELLECTENNIAINFAENQEIYCDRHKREAPPYKVEILDFCQENPASFSEFDVLIGCEIVFDPSIVPELGRFIKTFLVQDSSKSCHMICTIRNEATFKCFTDELERLQLKNSVVDISSSDSVVKICSIVHTF